VGGWKTKMRVVLDGWKTIMRLGVLVKVWEPKQECVFKKKIS
jgi:hypothetical protein